MVNDGATVNTKHRASITLAHDPSARALGWQVSITHQLVLGVPAGMCVEAEPATLEVPSAMKLLVSLSGFPTSCRCVWRLAGAYFVAGIEPPVGAVAPGSVKPPAFIEIEQRNAHKSLLTMLM